MPVAGPSPSVTTECRGMAGGGGVRRSRTRSPLCASVPCSPHARGAGQEAQGVTVRHANRGRSCGHRTVSPAVSAAGVAWCGASGVAVASWPSLAVVPRSSAGVSRCGTPPTACPPTGAASAFVPSVRSPYGVAGGSWGAPRVSLPRPQTVPDPASPCGGLPRAQGAGKGSDHPSAQVFGSPTCAGSGVRSQRVGVERAPRPSRAQGAGAPWRLLTPAPARRPRA